MKDIKFTYLVNKNVKTGTSGDVLALSEIDLSKSYGKQKNDLPLIQLFNTGYRVSKSNLDWNTWNGCVAVDIDSKNYENINKIDIDKMEMQIIQYLSADLWDNFYCEQRSASGNSFHFFFYFDCAKNEHNFKSCVNLALYKTRQAFEDLGYENIAKQDGVLDDCTKKSVQGLYVTSYDFKYNVYTPEINGQIDIEELEAYSPDNEIVYEQTEIVFKNSKIKYKSNPVCDIEDWHNENRRRLITILSKYFNGDKDRAKECFTWAYDNVFGKYIDNHTRESVLDLFDRHFENIYRGDYPFHHVMLEFCKNNFGMKFSKKFVPKIINDIKYNETIELGDDKLSSVFYDIINKNHSLIEIVAGCGSGKTYAAKSLSTFKDMDMIDLIFLGETKMNKKICFITPMTSINRDNFENENGWMIIDGEHDDIDKIKMLRNGSKSVCTTWTSFILHNMINLDFDLFVFDEIHTLYLYDYRKEIKYIKNAINTLKLRNKKTVLLTGTPSNEIYEFDSYKIKINNNTTNVNCDLVFYNEQFKGFLVDDVTKWLDADKNNLVAIFADMANVNTRNNFEDFYGITIDTLYNKKNIADVDYVVNKHMWRGRTMLCSVYGQAGININIPDDKKVRIYILNTCGMSAIQFANRIRNKERIDKIIIPYKNENISNTVVKTNLDVDTTKVFETLNEKNKINPIPNEVICAKNKQLINLSMGLHTYYTSYNMGMNMWEIDEIAYKDYEIIKRTIQFEKQTQILYNRLIEANFNVNVIYLEKDTKDDHAQQIKQNHKFVGKMREFPKDCIVKRKKDESLYINTREFEINIYLSDNDNQNIEYILNHIKNKILKGKENDKEHVYNKFMEIVNNIYDNTKTFTKVDLRRWKKIYEIENNYGLYVDDWYMKQLMDNKDIDLINLASTYVTMLFNDMPKKDILFSALDDAYRGLKELYVIIYKYNWMMPEGILNASEDSYIDNNNDNKDIIEFRKKLFLSCSEYLTEKYVVKNKDKCKQIEIDDTTYNSIIEASKILNVSKMTINRWLKNGKAKYIA